MTLTYSDTTLDYVDHPILVVCDPSGIVFSGGERHNNHEIEGWPIHFPYINTRDFFGPMTTSSDIGMRVRLRMGRLLLKTGLFGEVIVQPGQLVVGWLPVLFTLSYEGNDNKRDGVLTYPHE